MRSALFVLVMTLATMSCSSPSGDVGGQALSSTSVPRTESDAAPALTARPLDGQSLPLEPLIALDEDSQKVLHEAVDALNARCMSETGYEFIAYPARPFRSILAPNERYGYVSPERARVDGYLSSFPQADPPTFLAAVEAVDEKRLQFGPDYDKALYGDGALAEGCDQQSRKRIYGVAGGVFEMAGSAELIQLQSDSNDELYVSDAGSAAVGEWSSCMSEAGYSFAQWWAAREAFANTDEVSRPHLAQAMTDAACRRQVRLEERLFDAEAKIMERLTNESSDLVESVQEQIDNAVAAASDITAQG